MAREAIGMLLLHGGTPRDRQAREAEDREAALLAVWNAVAAAGVDDHILFLEHPDLPEHWRLRSGSPAQP